MNDLKSTVSAWYQEAIDPKTNLPAVLDLKELGLEEDDFFSDEPSADPNIRLEYQAALGAFVVAYNQLDHQIAKIFRFAFHIIDRAPPRLLPKTFGIRVELLDLLGAFDVLGLRTVPFDEIRKVNSMRHVLVHGHFDQNPFDGSFTLVTPKDGSEFKVKTETVRDWTARAEKAWESLRNAEARFLFRDVVVPDQKGAPSGQ